MQNFTAVVGTGQIQPRAYRVTGKLLILWSLWIWECWERDSPALTCGSFLCSCTESKCFVKFHLIWPLCIDFLFSRRWKWNNAFCSPFVLTFGVLQIEGFCSFKAFPLFQRGKMSQIKIRNSMILGFYVTLFSILCFPASPNFPKMSKVPFQGDNRRAPSSGFIPGPLEFCLWDLSWCFQPGELLVPPRPILHFQGLVPGGLWLP